MRQDKLLKQPERRNGLRLKWILFLVWTTACIGAGYYGARQISMQQAPMMKGNAGEAYVITGQPILKDIRPHKAFIAFVEPINAVNLKAQVAGTIDDVLFENGSFVQEGDVLFVIDKRKYEANVQSAQASLNKANANVVQIQNDYKRQLKLYKDKFLPKAELEVAESNLEQAKAEVLQAEATLKLARLDLEYATVTAPISGYISKAHVTKGNYVDTNSAVLARIVQTNPVRISFSVTDKERLEKLGNESDFQAPISMKLILSNGNEVSIKPQKMFTDRETSADTATLSVYVEYENTDQFLLPGNVISVQVADTAPKNVILIPQTAILQDSNGKYVMKTDEAGIATQQYIETNDVYENMAVIDAGLTLDDTIIVSGGQKVRSGQKVKSVNSRKKALENGAFQKEVSVNAEPANTVSEK